MQLTLVNKNENDLSLIMKMSTFRIECGVKHVMLMRDLGVLVQIQTETLDIIGEVRVYTIKNTAFQNINIDIIPFYCTF